MAPWACLMRARNRRPAGDPHDSDFYAWTQEQAGYRHDPDPEHLAEERAPMGAHEPRDPTHRPAIPQIGHLPNTLERMP